jgi:hypothetical protein
MAIPTPEGGLAQAASPLPGLAGVTGCRSAASSRIVSNIKPYQAAPFYQFQAAASGRISSHFATRRHLTLHHDIFGETDECP